MRKLLILLPVLVLLIVFTAAAEKNYTGEKVVFLPQDFYVGDLVEMRIVILPEAGVTVSKPERFPDSYWVKIENAEVIASGEQYELRLYLRPFAPGIRTLPAVQFGDVLLRDIRIQTKSILEDPQPFSPPADQLLLPGTKYYIAMLTGIVFLMPVFFIIFWTRFKTGIQSYILERSRRRPYKRLQKILKDLEAELKSTSGKRFYTVLIDELRIYLTERGSIDYSSATVREGAARIVSDFASVSAAPELIELFRLADEVKFGSRRVMIRKREEALALVNRTAAEIEDAMTGGSKDVDI